MTPKLLQFPLKHTAVALAWVVSVGIGSDSGEREDGGDSEVSASVVGPYSEKGESAGAGLDPAGHPSGDLGGPGAWRSRWGGWFESLQGRCDLWNSGSEGKGGEMREGKGKRTEQGGGEERCCDDLREASAQRLRGGEGD